MGRLYIERDVERFFGYYVMTDSRCIAYTFTRWGAKRVFNRYKSRIIQEVES